MYSGLMQRRHTSTMRHASILEIILDNPQDCLSMNNAILTAAVGRNAIIGAGDCSSQ
jgi:hypothetical protein